VTSTSKAPPELVETYEDLGLGTVDASVIAVAERHGATIIATLDRRQSALSAHPTSSPSSSLRRARTSWETSTNRLQN
jgi:hypothetical protein